MMYKLDGSSGNRNGLGITLKVMTGDTVKIFGRSFWNSAIPTNTGHGIVVNDLLTLLANTSAIAGAGKGATSGALIGSGVTPTELGHWLADSITTTSGRPRAYINWILFDEQFRIVSSSSGFSTVSTANDIYTHSIPTVNITKNGYLYAYCSNESDVSVFFDNFQLIHKRGPLLETAEYYPFGLTMAGISSKAAGKLENRFKYNGGSELQSHEFSDESGIEVYDTYFRQLDPQLGRWWQIDPKPNESESPYASMGNNPILNNDILGDTLRGFDKTSAQRMQTAITGSFSGDKATQGLFKLGADGTTFAPVDMEAFAKATGNLNNDQLALATAYATAIDGTSNQVVSMVTQKEALASGVVSSLPSNGGNRTGADIDNNYGGGVNVAYGKNGSLSVIVTNSTASIPDFVNSKGKNYSSKSSAGELLAHETLGHGMGRTNSSSTYGHQDAVQMTNLYKRSQGSTNYRDGTSHGTGVKLTSTQASGIPSVYQSNVNLAGFIQMLRKIK
jgi:RHS repeat-associated protein